MASDSGPFMALFLTSLKESPLRRGFFFQVSEPVSGRLIPRAKLATMVEGINFFHPQQDE